MEMLARSPSSPTISGMGRGKRRSRATAAAWQQELDRAQELAEAEKDAPFGNRDQVAGMVFGWKRSENRAAVLNDTLKAQHDEASARLGLPVKRVIEDEYLSARRTQAIGAFTEALTRNRHLLAVYGPEAEAEKISLILADILEQGHVEIDAQAPDAVEQFKTYAVEPVTILLRNLPDSDLERRVDFRDSGHTLLVDGEEVQMGRLTSIYLPVSSDNPPIDEILAQAEPAPMFTYTDLFDPSDWSKDVSAVEVATLAAASIEHYVAGSSFPELQGFPQDPLLAACQATVRGLKAAELSLKGAPTTEQLAELWVGFVVKYCNQYNAVDSTSAVDQAMQWSVVSGLSPYFANRLAYRAILAELHPGAQALADELEGRMSAANGPRDH